VGSVVKATDLHPANVGSAPNATHTSYWWWYEGNPAKIAPMQQKKSYLSW